MPASACGTSKEANFSKRAKALKERNRRSILGIRKVPMEEKKKARVNPKCRKSKTKQCHASENSNAIATTNSKEIKCKRLKGEKRNRSPNPNNENIKEGSQINLSIQSHHAITHTQLSHT